MGRPWVAPGWEARLEAPNLVSYQLEILLTRAAWIRVGALGRFRLAAGRYVYTGSARGCLRRRLHRHLAVDKRRRWHVDHLLASPYAHVVAVRVSPLPECRWNAATPGSIPIPGFGAGDCRAGCGAHLKRLPGA